MTVPDRIAPDGPGIFAAQDDKLVHLQTGGRRALTAGPLLDIYAADGRTDCRIKQAESRRVRLVDGWTPSIDVAADDRADLDAVLRNDAAMQFVKEHGFVRRRERISDPGETVVVKLTLSDSARGPATARRIERLGKFGRF